MYIGQELEYDNGDVTAFVVVLEIDEEHNRAYVEYEDASCRWVSAYDLDPDWGTIV
jgi:hypothetical protein